MLASYIASDRNFGIVAGLLVLNLEVGQIVSTYKTLSLHDVHLSGSLVLLRVMNRLDLRYQSSGSFPFALSETESSREVAGYGSKTLPLQKRQFCRASLPSSTPVGLLS